MILRRQSICRAIQNVSSTDDGMVVDAPLAWVKDRSRVN
jgi:hypothetical protein